MRATSWKWVAGLYASYQDLDNWFDRYGVSARNSRTEVDTTNLPLWRGSPMNSCRRGK